MGDQHFRGRPHHPAGTVVLGDPEAMIPPLLRLLSQLNGVLKGFGGGFGPIHRALIQDAKLQTEVSPNYLLIAVVQAVMVIKKSC